MDSGGVLGINPSVDCFPPKPDDDRREEERSLYRRIENVVKEIPVPDDFPNILSIRPYQGFWYTKPLLTGLMACQQYFQALPSDVLLTTVPRSGTTWFKALIFSTVHRGTYHPSSPTHPLLSRNPHELVPFLDLLYVTDRVPDLTAISSPRVLATHLAYSALPGSVERSRCKIVHVFRNNARANLVSRWRWWQEFFGMGDQQMSLEWMVDQYTAGRLPYGATWDVVGGYWEESRKDPERVLFLRYEEAEADPVGTLRKLAGFLGWPFSPEEEASGVPSAIVELCSFGRLSTLEVNRGGSVDLVVGEAGKQTFFTKEENRKLVGRLTVEIGDRVDRMVKEKLGARGLEV